MLLLAVTELERAAGEQASIPDIVKYFASAECDDIKEHASEFQRSVVLLLVLIAFERRHERASLFR